MDEICKITKYDSKIYIYIKKNLNDKICKSIIPYSLCIKTKNHRFVLSLIYETKFN